MITRSSYWWLAVFVVALLVFAYLIATVPAAVLDPAPNPPTITTRADSD